MKQYLKNIHFCSESTVRVQKSIRQLDKMSGRNGRFMWVFIAESIYFIVTLGADYEGPAYMAGVASFVVMLHLLLYMISFTTIEDGNWRPVYEKIKYFPIDTKKYLLSKLFSASLIIAFQMVILLLSFFCRFCMNRAVDAGVICFIMVCAAVSGVCYFAGLLVLYVLGTEKELRFDVLKYAIFLLIAIIAIINETLI